MDPYLEGALWSDVHHELASQIRKQLTPQLAPEYVARIEPYLTVDQEPGSEIGILYPDVGIFDRRELREPAEVGYEGATPTPPSFEIASFQPVEWRIPVVEIVHRNNNRIVTSIEVVSPINKRGKGLKQYKAKRHKLLRSGVHFLEIDLIRRGTRTFSHPKLKNYEYVIALHRAVQSRTEIWGLNLSDRLPVLPVPLLPQHEEVLIDLSKALETIYQEAAYHLSIDYKQDPPPPPLPS